MAEDLKRSGLLFGTIIFCSSLHLQVRAAEVRTAVVDPTTNSCGTTYSLYVHRDTYRVIMPPEQLCPHTDFNCAINFKYLRTDGRYVICIDYGRMQLTGNSTKLKITGVSYFSSLILTNSKHPRVLKSMDTIKCFSHLHRKVTLTFTSECDGDGPLLRDHFTSWLYVYLQPDSDTKIYHVDGTCKHKENLYAGSDLKVVVRSYIWQDTANEPADQTCSLKLENHRSYSAERQQLLCPKWDFDTTPCELSVSAGASFAISTILSRKQYDCHKHKTDVNGCISFDVLHSPTFIVERNRNLSRGVVIEDGARFFQVTANRKIEEPFKMEKETYDSGSDSSEEDISLFDNGVFLKIIIPIAVLFGICCCLCGVSQKKTKTEQQQFNSVLAHVSNTANMRPVPSPSRRAQEPLITPHPTQRTDNTRRNQASTRFGDNEMDRMVAPPPSYGDVERTRPSAPAPSSQNYRSSPRLAHIDVDPVPPPDITDGPSGAPPAYDELFP